MHDDKVTFRDHPVDLDVHRPEPGEEILHGLPPVACQRIVLLVVVHNQLIKRISIARAKRIKESGNSFLIRFSQRHGATSR